MSAGPLGSKVSPRKRAWAGKRASVPAVLKSPFSDADAADAGGAGVSPDKRPFEVDAITGRNSFIGDVGDGAGDGAGNGAIDNYVVRVSKLTPAWERGTRGPGCTDRELGAMS